MPINPPTQDDIYTDIRDRVVASDANITNWSPNSPERALTDDGFASLLEVLWHATLAAQLSGWIDYAGGPIDESDLDDLGLTPASNGGSVDLELLNSMVRDADLDAKAAQNSVTRDPGAFATGEIEITTTNDSVVVDDGFRIQTDAVDPFTFETTEEVTPSSGSTTVTAPIQAVERGAEYNVGSGTITVMPSPPPGVQGVTNPSATAGGEDEETNAELRERAKQAIVQNSGGGTVGGIEGGLVSAFDGVDTSDVIVDEFRNADPVYADVIVDGGPSDSEAQNEIDELRPTAITHNLVRPTQVTIDVTADVTGSDVDTTALEDAVTDYLQGLGIGEDVIRDSIIATLMTEDPDVTGIDSLTVSDPSGTVSDDRTVGDRVPRPFPQDPDTDLQQWLTELQAEVDDVDSALEDVLDSQQIANASDQALDELGTDFGVLGKRRGRDDEQYRAFLLGLVAAFDGRGTPPGLRLAIAAGVLADRDDISLLEDFDTQEYEVVLEDEAWSPHKSGTVRELADLADPSVVQLREPVHNRLELATVTVATGDTELSEMHVSEPATPRIIGTDTEHETVNSASAFGTGQFDGKDTFS